MPVQSSVLVAPRPLADVQAELVADLKRYVNETCDRIETADPQLRAVLPEPDRRERLLREAAALEEHFPEIGARPPLFGVLVGVKDIFNVDGFDTRAGSAVPAESFAGAEASCVTRLKEAGALILGKTVTTEFAYFDPGATTNPHDATHTPGGSSSGSAAAVAAGFAPLALGSQTVGSVIRPAAFCGVVGFKPSYERVRLDGVLPFSPSVDTVGWFTADVASAEAAAQVIVADWKPPEEPAHPPVLAVPDGPYLAQVSHDGEDAFESAIVELAATGLEIRRVPALAEIAAINERHTFLTAAGFASIHARRFRDYGGLVRGKSSMFFDIGRGSDGAIVDQAKAGRLQLRRELELQMTDEGVDAWVSPSAIGPAPEGLETTGDPAMNLPWTHAGLPTITLPAGSVGGLPVGLQISGRFKADEQLLGWATQIEATLSSSGRDTVPSS